jgi:hypothetical protein
MIDRECERCLLTVSAFLSLKDAVLSMPVYLAEIIVVGPANLV